MAETKKNTLHPGISDEFNEEQYGQNSWGVRNPQVTNMTTGAWQGRPANTPNRPRKQFQNETASEYTEPGEAANSNYAPPIVAPRLRERKRNFIADTVIVNVARVRAVPVAMGICVWAVPYYLFIILPLGVLATLSLGLAVMIEYYTGQAGGDLVEGIVEQFSGMDFSVFMALFLILSGLLCFFSWLQIIIASVIFKMAFIKPWFGQGTSFKTGSIILVLLSSFFPLLQMFPLFFLWLAAVVARPK